MSNVKVNLLFSLQNQLFNVLYPGITTVQNESSISNIINSEVFERKKNICTVFIILINVNIRSENDKGFQTLRMLS